MGLWDCTSRLHRVMRTASDRVTTDGPNKWIFLLRDGGVAFIFVAAGPIYRGFRGDGRSEWSSNRGSQCRIS